MDHQAPTTMTRERHPRSALDAGGATLTALVAIALTVLAFTAPPAGLDPGTLGRWSALLLLMAAASWIESAGVIPDKVTGPGISIGVILQMVLPHGQPEAGFWGIVVAYGVSALLATLCRLATGLDPLGSEAWKRAAMMGAFLGWFGASSAYAIALLLARLLTAGAGSPASKAGRRVPLGLLMALGAFVVMCLKATGLIHSLP